MKRAAAAWFACLPALLGALAAQQATFKVDVQLVRMLVTVKDDYGRLIGGLSKDAFTVLDNGVRQELAVFEHHTSQPLSVALLLDTSLSTMKELEYETASVVRFLRAFLREGNPEDSLALFTFDYQVTELVPFSRRLERFERALRTIKPVGGTTLYDAISLAAEQLQDRSGRHVIVLVTDGGDTTSTRTFHEALEAAHMADSVIYSVLVMPITNDAGRNIGGENALTNFAISTGGRVFAPSSADSLDAAFQEILRDLRSQYLLGFYPRNVPATKERFHRIDVRLARPELRAITRTGYYESSENAGTRR